MTEKPPSKSPSHPISPTEAGADSDIREASLLGRDAEDASSQLSSAALFDHVREVEEGRASKMGAAHGPDELYFGPIGGIARLLLQALILFLSIWALNRSWKTMPPMGQLLSPFRGIWMSHRSQFERVTGEARLALPGLNAPVVIRVDQDQVKHIFAQNDEDLYFAQGFVVATDRLWQMDFVARLAGGRLSQMVGPRGLDIDRIFTKMGLPQAAADTSTLMLADPVRKRCERVHFVAHARYTSI